MKLKRLRLKRVDSVGFVDRGANQVADIMIWKRDTGDDMADQKKQDEVQKVAEQIVAALQKSGYATATDSGYATATDAAGVLAMIADILAKNGYATATDRSGYATATDRNGYATATDRLPFLKRLMKAFGATDAEVAAVEKVDAPKEEPMNAEVTKRLAEADERAKAAEAVAKAAEDRVAKLELAARTASAIAKAEKLTHLPVKAADFGVILRKVDDGEKLTDAEKVELERVLAAANEATRVGKMLTEIGSGAPAEGSAAAKVEAMAAEIRKNDPTLSEQAARGKVYEKNPKLLAEVEAEAAR